MNNLYDENSIQSLTPLEFTRLRPGVYVGSTEYSTQLLIEIVSNAVDEFKAGHGDTIKVDILDDDTVIVEDNGQGFLVNSKRDDGKTILEASFSVLNTSGKYSEDGVYEGTALGLNGIGSKLPTFLSHWLEVTSFRDGKYEHIWFEEGVFKKREIGDWQNGTSGTIVQWKPSEEFFEHTEVELSVIAHLFKVLVCLCPGLTINFNFKGTENSYYSKRGLNDLVDESVKDKELLKNRFNFNYSKGKYQMNMALTYVDHYSSTIIPYVNTGLTDSGPHITQIKTILTREFNKFFREKKWLKEKEDNLSGDDIQEGLFMVFNITAPGVSYNAQTKAYVVKIDMTPFTSELAKCLQIWFKNNEKEIKIIADKALAARRAREAARKARENARKPKETGLKAKMSLSNKFIDCSSKNPKERNLLLVEGLSAAGSTLEARNVKTDCIYMLRGKIISPLKQTVDKILANQEMSDIVRVIGAGFGNDNFDLNKMMFDKIVITSDQDSDGLDIELLLITFFYTYMRPLVEAGKLYRAVTPLYIISTKKDRIYCYTEKELEEWKNQNTEKYDLVHCKGLGELDAATLKEVCFEHQRYKRITVSDAKATTELLEILQGQSVAPRKQFIYDNATQLGFNFM
jgi:DNA gyrase/topoisomerase IV subunit B